jgi:hypothetical protein
MQGGGGSKLWKFFAPDRLGATHAFPQNSENFFLPTSNADLATARAGHAYVAIANRQAEIMITQLPNQRSAAEELF